MNNVVVVIAAIVLLAGLLFGEKRERRSLILGFKTPLSCLFVLMAVIQPHPLQPYYYFVVAGLILGLVGDVCLAIPGNRAFRAGLAAFLLGHLLYVVAFVGLGRLSDWLTPAHAVIVGISGVVFWRLRPHLGGMLVPVALYVVVITAMLMAAWVAFLNPDLKSMGARSVLLGAALFYVSDLFVARDRFLAQGFINRLIGLPLYYGGQFLLAFSAGFLG